MQNAATLISSRAWVMGGIAGMREFRENLAGYLESGKPLAITRHGETLGFFIQAQKRSRKTEVEAMRAAA